MIFPYYMFCINLAQANVSLVCLYILFISISKWKTQALSYDGIITVILFFIFHARNFFI